MTDMPTSSPPGPAARRRWWNIALVASLALNLLFAGAVAARFVLREPIERMASTSYLQLVPRKFFGELDRQRRDELFAVLKPYRERFRDGQQSARALVIGLADALAASPYDDAKVRDAVAAFGNNGSDLIALGSQAAVDVIARLSAEERSRLAQLMRERAKTGRRK